MEILEKQELVMKNIISCRNMHKPQNVCEDVPKILKFLTDNKLMPTAPLCHVIFGASNGMLDVEFLQPVDREIKTSGSLIFKKEIVIKNAIKARHCGDEKEFKNSAKLIDEYIQHNNLKPVTCTYYVPIRVPNNEENTSKCVVDIYIGISEDSENSGNVF